jgi:hypothetical protein
VRLPKADAPIVVPENFGEHDHSTRSGARRMSSSRHGRPGGESPPLLQQVQTRPWVRTTLCRCPARNKWSDRSLSAATTRQVSRTRAFRAALGGVFTHLDMR